MYIHTYSRNVNINIRVKEIPMYIHTYITLHYITLYYITFYYITLHSITFCYITLHCITYIHTYIYIHYVCVARTHVFIHLLYDDSCEKHMRSSPGIPCPETPNSMGFLPEPCSGNQGCLTCLTSCHGRWIHNPRLSLMFFLDWSFACDSMLCEVSPGFAEDLLTSAIWKLHYRTISL